MILKMNDGRLSSQNKEKGAVVVLAATVGT